jgi:hypothetical protein
LSARATIPGAASGTKWLETSIPALPYEQPSRSAPLRSTSVTRKAATRAVVRGAQADDAAADDDDTLAHRLVPDGFARGR